MTAPERRSSTVLTRRREPLPWPSDREFRILAIDGGGIRGIFPACVLAELEERYLSGSSITRYFDLITGNSTGGIIAIGLGAGLRAAKLRDLYMERGGDVFPPVGPFGKSLRFLRGCFKNRYRRDGLEAVLYELLGDRTLGESRARLCIPSCDGRYSDLYVFKTPHHPDYRLDFREKMTKVAAATSAAPTYFRPLDDGGFTFVDGGLWANNPIMVGLVEAMSCFAVPRERIRILSLGCGDSPFTISQAKKTFGGLLAWWDVVLAAMRFQSLGAVGQASLLIGADRIVRVEPNISDGSIGLDDWERAAAELPACAERALEQSGSEIAAIFLQESAEPYTPLIP